jgi:hypothetical protein
MLQKLIQFLQIEVDYDSFVDKNCPIMLLLPEGHYKD